MTAPLRLAFAMRPGLLPQLFTAEALAELERVATFDASRVAHEFDDETLAGLGDVEVLVTGWGCHQLTGRVLNHMPRLRAVVHAGGSVKHHLPDEFWDRDIAVSSAAETNAGPVAEYTLAAILMANKGVLTIAEDYRRLRSGIDLEAAYPEIGNYGKQVGIVGASRIGRRVIELLRPFELTVAVSDPYLDEDDAQALGVTVLPLDELVATSDVVSLHAPDLPETRHLMDSTRLASMKPGATLINTARGRLVDQAALTDAVVAGRINAVIDVTTPEVTPADSPLYELPNVLLTPHIAGSLGTELARMGHSAVAEVARIASGECLLQQVRFSELERTA